MFEYLKKLFVGGKKESTSADQEEYEMKSLGGESKASAPPPPNDPPPPLGPPPPSGPPPEIGSQKLPPEWAPYIPPLDNPPPPNDIPPPPNFDNPQPIVAPPPPPPVDPPPPPPPSSTPSLTQPRELVISSSAPKHKSAMSGHVKENENENNKNEAEDIVNEVEANEVQYDWDDDEDEEEFKNEQNEEKGDIEEKSGFKVPAYEGSRLALANDSSGSAIVKKADKPLCFPKTNELDAAFPRNSMEDYKDMIRFLVSNYKPPYQMYANSDEEKNKMGLALASFIAEETDNDQKLALSQAFGDIQTDYEEYKKLSGEEENEEKEEIEEEDELDENESLDEENEKEEDENLDDDNEEEEEEEEIENIGPPIDKEAAKAIILSLHKSKSDLQNNEIHTMYHQTSIPKAKAGEAYKLEEKHLEAIEEVHNKWINKFENNPSTATPENIKKYHQEIKSVSNAQYENHSKKLGVEIKRPDYGDNKEKGSISKQEKTAQKIAKNLEIKKQNNPTDSKNNSNTLPKNG